MSDEFQEELASFTYQHSTTNKVELNEVLSEATMERIKKEFLRRAEIQPIIPPPEIVNGHCTMAELTRYLSINKIEDIRALEAAQIIAWLAPMAKAMNGDMPQDFNLRDILGNPDE